LPAGAKKSHPPSTLEPEQNPRRSISEHQFATTVSKNGGGKPEVFRKSDPAARGGEIAETVSRTIYGETANHEEGERKAKGENYHQKEDRDGAEHWERRRENFEERIKSKWSSKLK